MDRISVESSALASVGYDSGTSLFEVELRNGRIYQYFAVPESVYDGLMSASGKGAYFNQNIRNAYSYAQVG
jgi:hypothetical protein